jgi:hypothetical protein
MGGKKSAPKPQPKPAIDPMMVYLQQQQVQQAQQAAASAEAQRQALMQSQIQAGAQAELAGEQTAKQGLATAGSMQSIRDANALQSAQTAASTAGQQATGGGFDLNAARQQALTNLGAGTSMIPQTPANISPMGQPQAANMFSLPKTSDLKFGGS